VIAPVSDPRPSVLIVDDESAILDTLRILLKNEGFETHVALGGKQGIERLQDVKPDIVITDVRMPHVGGLEVLSAAGVEVELEDRFEARAQNEAWRTWVAERRPFVTYKAAITLDGRVTVPGQRWVSGEASRRLVHELRAASDAVAVGMGTVRADMPRLDARGVEANRQPRRLAFGKGPLPPGSELELRSGRLRDELEALAAEGVQSLLVEGGPTLAGALLAEDLVDKLLVFVAPTLAGSGPTLVAGLDTPATLRRLTARPVGEDVLLSAYVHEP
jgi:diaminohydroxyphosphoribosylaminopyrimidine deaminase/5-amino-6-(5-phosphoribosylamino)uracil reductase